jgi:hypothetical protein
MQDYVLRIEHYTSEVWHGNTMIFQLFDRKLYDAVYM